MYVSLFGRKVLIFIKLRPATVSALFRYYFFSLIKNYTSPYCINYFLCRTVSDHSSCLDEIQCISIVKLNEK